MKILITGGSGLVGSSLINVLLGMNYDVAILTRNPSSNLNINQYFWDPSKFLIDEDALIDIDCIVHLAGTNISDNRWTKKQKQIIYSSRVESAEFLYQKIKELDVPLKSFVSSSAVGCYGTITTDQIYTEQDHNADDYLGQLCTMWETKADQFINLGCKVSKVRTGIVLSSKGGVLPKMIFPFNWCLGAALGSGNQFIPWIHIDDLCAIFTNIINENIPSGVYNGVAPETITNNDLTCIIAKELNMPLWLPNIPSWVLKIIFGEMSSILLNGSRVSSKKLIQSGFEFKYLTIRSAIHSLI